jgi:hypothetical protein
MSAADPKRNSTAVTPAGSDSGRGTPGVSWPSACDLPSVEEEPVRAVVAPELAELLEICFDLASDTQGFAKPVAAFSVLALKN